MKRLIHRHCVGLPCVALWTLALLAAGCAASTPQSSGSGGGSGAGTNGTGAGGAGASASGTGGAGASGSGAGGSGAGGTSPTTSGTGGTGPSGTDAGTSGTGGGGAGTGGAVARTTELIGPGGATCGATNATHGDGFICVLNYPNAGTNVVGYWFDYAFSAGTCNVTFTKPAGNSAANPQVCFSGSACAATSGGGLGLALCDVHGINVSTWPELMMLESASSLSSTVKSPFSGCNPGATMTSVSWTVGSGSIPAGTSVLFDDAADVNVARVDNLAAGATSVAVPANVDTRNVASIKFSVSGASSTSWSFCLTSLKLSLQ
ncbi:MAG TPA: hypothetical protein VFH68_08200 [Polyangia bacterium]|nr:hypothetical protein [Polyangia bacterium]